MLIPKTRNIALFSLIFLIVSAVAFGFVVYKTSVLSIELQEQAVVIAQNNSLKQKHTELLNILKDTEQEREILSDFLLTEDSTIRFLSEIEQYAKAHGVSLTTNILEVSETKTPLGFNILDVQFSFEGEKSQVKNLIRTFEELPYHGKVTDISLVRKGTSVDGVTRFSGKIDLELSLLTP